jgi:hypothetical protein
MLAFGLDELLFVAAAIGGLAALLVSGRRDGATRRDRGEPGHRGSPVPLPLAFVAVFGVGGLVAARVLDVHGLQAIVAASGAGMVALGLAVLLRDAERPAKD